MSERLAVLVTGSAGRIGRAVCAELSARGHQVRGFDRRPTPEVAEPVTGDLSDAAALKRAMSGRTALVHLAATPDEDDFLSTLLPNNIAGLYRVMEAAREAGVKRVALASSCQVNTLHPGPWPATPEMPPSPGNWYASTKLFAEGVGHLYAQRHGMRVAAVRIGWCPRDEGQVAEISESAFAKDIYISPGDVGRLFARAVETDRAFRFLVVFGTSRPLHETRFDLGAAREWLGFEPRDSWPAGAPRAQEA